MLGRNLRVKSSWEKRFEGWQLGLLVVVIASSITAVVVPRSAVPEGLPPSSVTPAEIEVVRAENARLADRAAAGPLHSTAALLGARMRLVGRSEWDADDSQVNLAYESVLDAGKVALFQDVDSVAQLQAYQARLFRQAYLHFLHTGERTDDLIELGGSTLAQFAQNGWFQTEADLPPYTDVMLEAFFKRRFTRLIGSTHPQLAGDPREERAVISFLLANPPRISIEQEANLGGDGKGTYLLRRIDDLAKLEPTYPVPYAKGIVLYQMGHFEASAIAFDTYLQQVSSGPYRLRAVNYLKSAVERTEGL